jgi:hypothetical protein
LSITTIYETKHVKYLEVCSDICIPCHQATSNIFFLKTNKKTTRTKEKTITTNITPLLEY